MKAKKKGTEMKKEKKIKETVFWCGLYLQIHY